MQVNMFPVNVKFKPKYFTLRECELHWCHAESKCNFHWPAEGVYSMIRLFVMKDLQLVHQMTVSENRWIYLYIF